MAAKKPVEYASFLPRFVAFLIDALILIVAGILVPFLKLLGILVPWLYFAYLESSEKQATLGKTAMGLKVTDMDGKRLSFATATVRYFAKILSALILFLGFVMIAFDAKKQGLHDKIAGTLVVPVAKQ